MRVSATARYVRGSTRKARLVVEAIRGRSVEEATALLRFMPQHAAKDVAGVLKSAAANAENNLNMATVGQVGNLDHENQNLGKAGRARHMGQRPEVRGVVMNPRDHPHGGGEGKSPTGMPPKTPWGKPAMGYRTRRARTGGLIVRSRHRK